MSAAPKSRMARRAVLVKGGHIERREATDVLFDGHRVPDFSSAEDRDARDSRRLYALVGDRGAAGAGL